MFTCFILCYDNSAHCVGLGTKKIMFCPKVPGFIATNVIGNSPDVSFKISALVATETQNVPMVAKMTRFDG